MKNIAIESFPDFYDAMYFLETRLEEGYDAHEENIRGEITLIGGVWRVGVYIDDAQLEIDFYDGFVE